jgi:hypothetical protein
MDRYTEMGWTLEMEGYCEEERSKGGEEAEGFFPGRPT